MATVKMTGIDVSYWQGNPNADAFKTFKNAGWDFVIARIGYASGGQRYPDSTFETNYKNSNSAGLRIGAYFYSNACNAAEGKAEANYVISLLQGKALNLPIFIDVEDNGDIGNGKQNKSGRSLQSVLRNHRRCRIYGRSICVHIMVSIQNRQFG